VYEKLVRGRVTAAGKAIRIERRRRSDSDWRESCVLISFYFFAKRRTGPAIGRRR
jgi:hypothetical protein